MPSPKKTKISKAIDEHVLNFCKLISGKHLLDESDLYKCWKSVIGEEVQETSKEVNEIITREKVMNPSTTKDALIAMCALKGLKKNGKKDELVDRLLKYMNGEMSNENKDKSPPKITKKNTKDSKIVESIKKASDVYEITLNAYGNYEHTETGLVFNNDKIVFGVQSDDLIRELTPDDIENCKKYKFKYLLPKNLNTNKTLDNVKIDGLDDIEEDIEEEDADDDIEEEELEEDN